MEDGLAWRSLQWPDGTRYDGLVKADGVLHSHGVLTFPNKDRYEGMFEDGRMHGAGVYVWSNGTIYRGDWAHGHIHGCGGRIWKQPGGAGEVAGAYGKFVDGEYVGDVMPCAVEDAQDAAVDADMAAFQARSFLQWRKQTRPQQQQRQQPQRQQQQQPQHAQPETLWPRQAGGGGSGPADALDEQQQQKLAGLVQRLALQPQLARRDTRL